MTLAVWILAIPAVIIYAAQPVTAWWDRRNTELDHLIADALQPTDEWLAVLAATEPTPVYDALVCESIERAEGWAS